ncbi:MAG: L-2-hydroxyglutarate oxidase [SAR202 cluster bacterium]|nr:L-2-hydroxyglutarate oxidase [SAR202 cluster bacterium]
MASLDFEVVVIGAGIIGLASARALTRRFPKTRVAVLEKEEQLAFHQTGHNSGVIHSGIYYKPGSQKAKFCVAGVDALKKYCRDHAIPYEECGKVVVATDESQLGRMEELYKRGTANGVPGMEIISGEALKEIEPHAVGVKALLVPKTAIVDYKAVAAAYAEDFKMSGGSILTGHKLTAINHVNGGLSLTTSKGTVQTKHLVNCAGLYCDKVAAMMGVPPNVRILPFRGEYYFLRPESHHLVKGLIYPVPDPRFPFLGVHFTRRVTGEVDAGPNAVLAWSREGYTRSKINVAEAMATLTFPGFWRMSRKYWRIGMGEMHRSLMKSVFVKDLQRLVPDVKDSDFVGGGSGVRAQAVSRKGVLLDDFFIEESPGAIHVLNAPSPGATSSLAIGSYIAELAGKSFGLKG